MENEVWGIVGVGSWRGGAGALGSCRAWGQLCSLVTGDNVFLLLLKLTPVGFL